MNAARPPRILILDDDDNVRTVMHLIVQEAFPSANVINEASSHDALQHIEAAVIDLLITDCYMPAMDGPTLVRRVRESRLNLPIVMVSGNPDAEKLGEAAGIDGFVAKLEMADGLASAIRSAVALRSPAQSWRFHAESRSDGAHESESNAVVHLDSTIDLTDESNVVFWARELAVEPATLKVLASVHGSSVAILRKAIETLTEVHTAGAA